MTITNLCRVLLVCLLGLGLSSVNVSSQQKKRIAVLDFDFSAVDIGLANRAYGGQQNLARIVADKLVVSLVSLGTVQVIERIQLEKLFREQNLDVNGRVDPSTVAKLGRILGVDAIVIGSASVFELRGLPKNNLDTSWTPDSLLARITINYRIMNTATAVIETTGEVTGISAPASQSSNLKKIASSITGDNRSNNESVMVKDEEIRIVVQLAVNDLVSQITGMVKKSLSGVQRQPAPSVLGNPQSNIRLTLHTREDRTVYEIGETVSYELTTNARGYFYLLAFSEKDVATCIFPNQQLNHNLFEAGTHVITSDGRDGFLIGEPIGKDVVVGLLSATPLALGGNRQDYTWNEVFAIIKDTHFAEYVSTKEQISQPLAQLTNWQAISLVLETTSRSSSQHKMLGVSKKQVNGRVIRVDGPSVYIIDIDKSTVQIGDRLFVQYKSASRNPGLLSSKRMVEVEIVEIGDKVIKGLVTNSVSVQVGDTVTNRPSVGTPGILQQSSSPRQTGNTDTNNIGKLNAKLPTNGKRLQLPPGESTTKPLPAPTPERIERYPDITCPDTVFVAREFVVQISLSLVRPKAPVVVKGENATPSGGIGLPLPPQPNQEPWKIEVVLSAPDFEFTEGQNAGIIELPPLKDSTPIKFHLKPKQIQHPREMAEINATLWHGANYLGQISRTVTISQGEKSGSDTPKPSSGNGRLSNAGAQVETMLNEGLVILSSQPQPEIKPPQGEEIKQRLATNKAAAPALKETDSAKVASLSQNPSQKPASPILALDLHRQSPDLTIYVKERLGKRGAGQMEIQIHSPHLQAMTSTVRIDPGVTSWLEDMYEKFAEKSGRDLKKVEPGTKYTLGKYAEGMMLGFGGDLYKKLAPRIFQEAFWKLMDDPKIQFTSIQIISDNPTIPWELMVPVRDNDKDRRGFFLGEKFNIGRGHLPEGVSPMENPPQSLTINRLSVIAPKYQGQNSLRHQPEEVKMLGQMRGYRPVPGRLSDVEALFANTPQGIIHFAGHGGNARAMSKIKDYAIQLEDGELNVQTWQGLNPRLAAHPFLFFNACHIGQTQRVANFVNGWGPAVLEAGASGYIGALWPINDRGAYEFAKTFYEILDAELKRGPITIAEVLRRTRQTFLTKSDPTFLAYVYYGDPNLTFFPPNR